MGVVYRAVDEALDREVALKVIAPSFADDPSFRERFRRESRLAARLREAHAVTVFHAGEADGALFVTMSLIDGPSLRELVELEGRLSPGRAADLVDQIANALTAAHSLGLVHRDVKPENVLVEARGGQEHAYLTDFGLTKNIASDSYLTQTGEFVGTPHYASPEQLRGQPVDARTDVYALGCVLYNALTGEVPFPRETPGAVLLAHALEPLPRASARVPGLPPDMDEVIAHATAKEPTERFQSARELAEAVRHSAAAVGPTRPSGREPTVQREPPSPPDGSAFTGTGSRRRRWIVLALVGLILVGAGAVTAVVLATRDGKSHASSAARSGTLPSATRSTGTQPAKPVSRINLKGSGDTLGVAQILQSGSRLAIALVAQNVPPTTDKTAYAVWLYRFPNAARRLGYAPAVGKDGRLQGVSALPVDARKYNELIVTREPVTPQGQPQPTRPGPIILRGPLKLG